jgi:hypothetical protein
VEIPVPTRDTATMGTVMPRLPKIHTVPIPAKPLFY